ncbi:uncharacterized protein LOC127091492 isoform X2 [Lathyrus oleraceus]|uniref:uncharacterized protein LOC127091492 isoform X2 n=1 Tax=Pisum sativum TaxID=3888 RepID=UPI0021D0C02F|nr:uncharacterized protein LOC127091492 isoform X2 [Pisum sativum]XP_050886107.1 uncharacterized protein LOC127091492 isoform X2 [Pisum sativum]
MEICAETTHSNGKQTLKQSKSAIEVKRSSENTYRYFHSNHVKQNLKQTSTFINHDIMQLQMLGMRIEKSGSAISLRIHQEHLRIQLLAGRHHMKICFLLANLLRSAYHCLRW